MKSILSSERSIASEALRFEQSDDTGESLRCLRRGLIRSEGFSLFFAVCNTPARRDELIALLSDTMPDGPFCRVTVSPDTIDLLDTVVQQADDGSTPLMILDLDKSVASAAEEHEILARLNLGRPLWPEQVGRPVVFWIPEYLLTIMGRYAPDFLDWSSDIVFFPTGYVGSDSRELAPYRDSTRHEHALWDTTLRNQRIAELESRLRLLESRDDESSVQLKSQWYLELMNHYRDAGRIGDAKRIATRLVTISRPFVKNFIESLLSIGDLWTISGNIQEARSHYEQALQVTQRLSSGSPENAAYARALSVSYVRLGDVAVSLGDGVSARSYYQQSLSIDERLSSGSPENADYARDLSVSYNKLGRFHQSEGDHETARSYFLKDLAIAEQLASRSPDHAAWQRDLWISYFTLAGWEEQHGTSDAARAWWDRCREVLEDLERRGAFVQASDQGFLDRLRQKLDG